MHKITRQPRTDLSQVHMERAYAVYGHGREQHDTLPGHIKPGLDHGVFMYDLSGINKGRHHTPNNKGYAQYTQDMNSSCAAVGRQLKEQQ